MYYHVTSIIYISCHFNLLHLNQLALAHAMSSNHDELHVLQHVAMS